MSSSATSNTTLLQINNANIISTKTADLTFADVSNTITFTLNLPNTGNVAATDVTVIDILDSNLSFVPNSFTVNGQTIPNADLSTGVNIGSINGGNTAIVTFQATVTTLPTLNPISNSASITYHYVVDPSQPSITTSNQSNTTTTQINSAILTAQKIQMYLRLTLGKILSTPLQLQIAEMLVQQMLFLPILFQMELHLNRIVLHLTELASQLQISLQGFQLVISRQTNLSLWHLILSHMKSHL